MGLFMQLIINYLEVFARMLKNLHMSLVLFFQLKIFNLKLYNE